VFPERQNYSGDKFYDVEGRSGEGDDKFVKARMVAHPSLSDSRKNCGFRSIGVFES